MTRLFSIVLFVVAAFLSSPAFTFASENIPLYQVDLTLQEDGSFGVVETVHYDFGFAYRHGITRDIPLIHPQESSAFYKERFIEINIAQTLMDDKETPYQSTEEGGELLLKIGNPNQTITTEHKFTLAYTVKGGLQQFLDGHAELYWDAIGYESLVPIEKAVVNVIDEHGLFTGEFSCYVGAVGDTAPCGEVSQSTSTYSYTIDSLGIQRGVTVAFAVDDSVLVVVLERYNFLYFVIPAVGLLLLVLIVMAYRYRTKYKTGRAIIAQYEPYAGLKPMYTGVLLDDTLHPHDIAAGIIYLAQQGFITIKKTEKKVMFFFEVDDYEVTLVKPIEATNSRFETDVLRLLFDAVPSLGNTVALSEIRADHATQSANQKILLQLNTDIKKDLIKEGFFQSIYLKEAKWLFVIGTAVVVVAFVSLPLFALAFIAVSVTLVTLSRRRTRKGYEALDHLKGFKDFLATTEKERYKFHNVPTKSPEQFMEYLPYAIAFGVEKEWAEVFKDVTIPNPSWYDGDGGAAFSAASLTQSLGGFSTAFASSSGSSGGGSGGGGSVGGGGGGGSVGSW